VTISLHTIAAGTYLPMLTTLSSLLEKAEAYAKEHGKNSDAFLEAKLAPDMFTLRMQVGLACHHAQDGMARLTGGTPPSFDNMAGASAKTLAELKSAVTETIAALSQIKPAAFEGAENRKIAFPLQGPMSFESNGLEFLRDWSFGHFYFHAVTAYDILRHEGVPLGKRDYMSHIGPHVRQSS
jgi:uncharacterized protein